MTNFDNIPPQNISGNNLVLLLKSFSKEEWSEFEKFVISPYFNKGRNYAPALKVLKKYYPDFSSQHLTKEEIYKKIYPGKKYKESVVNSMFSRLYNLGEEFLLQRELSGRFNIKKEFILIKILHERGLSSKSRTKFKNAQEIIEKISPDENYYPELRTFANETAYYFYNNDDRSKVCTYTYDTLKYVLYAFLYETFFFSSSLYSQKNFWTENYEGSYLYNILEKIDIDEILKLIEDNDKEHFNFLSIPYYMHLSVKNINNDEFYLKLKELVYASLNKFEHNYKRQLLNTLALICTTKFVNGKNEFKKEAFEIRKKLVQENLFSLSSNAYIKTSEFRSTFLEALNVNQLSWAAEFADKFIKKLPPEFREDIDYYCKARISYENKNYDESILLAMKVNINQITFKLDMKNILAKIYYDTCSVESLYSLLSTYYQLVNNSSSQNKEFLARHLNFLKYFKQFLNIKFNNKDSSELKFLKDKITGDNVTSKYWLLKKVDEELSMNSK